MSNNIYGIDFGTCNFKVFSKSSGKVVSEKNTIAIINKTQIYAYGDDAYALAEARQRRAERNIGRDTVLRRVAGDQQILAEGVARFGIVKGHWDRPPPENWI